MREALAEAPVAVHQRQADRGIGIEHLLGGDDLDLVGVDVEPEFAEGDLLDRLVHALQRGEIPVRPLEQRLAVVEQNERGFRRLTLGLVLWRRAHETPKISVWGRRRASWRSGCAPAGPGCTSSTDRSRAW